MSDSKRTEKRAGEPMTRPTSQNFAAMDSEQSNGAPYMQKPIHNADASGAAVFTSQRSGMAGAGRFAPTQSGTQVPAQSKADALQLHAQRAQTAQTEAQHAQTPQLQGGAVQTAHAQATRVRTTQADAQSVQRMQLQASQGQMQRQNAQMPQGLQQMQQVGVTGASVAAPRMQTFGVANPKKQRSPAHPAGNAMQQNRPRVPMAQNRTQGKASETPAGAAAVAQGARASAQTAQTVSSVAPAQRSPVRPRVAEVAGVAAQSAQTANAAALRRETDGSEAGKKEAFNASAKKGSKRPGDKTDAAQAAKDVFQTIRGAFGRVGHILMYNKQGDKRGFVAVLAVATAAFFVVCALATLGIFYFSGSMLFRSVEEVDLPNFLGKTQEQVKADTNYGFDFEFVSVNTDKAPEGQIFDQTPKAPRNVKANAHIVLRVSAGVESVTVPDIVGLSRADAKAVMKESGLNIMLKPVVNETVEKDNVVSTEPAAGQTVNGDKVVYVYVSRGEDTAVLVPQLIGTPSLLEASRILLDAHLSYELSPEGGPDGEVLSQTPLAGEKVPRGSKIILTLAGGSTGTTVIPEYQEYGVDGHLHSYKPSSVVPPNSVSIGYTVFVCEECGYFYYGDFTQPTG